MKQQQNLALMISNSCNLIHSGGIAYLQNSYCGIIEFCGGPIFVDCRVFAYLLGCNFVDASVFFFSNKDDSL